MNKNQKKVSVNEYRLFRSWKIDDLKSVFKRNLKEFDKARNFDVLLALKKR